MVQKLNKYGNSVAVVLPKAIVAKLGLKAGEFVAVELEEDRVEIRPVDIVPKLSVEDRKFVDRLYKKRKKVFKKLAE